jgi:hypothetical protein
VFIAGRKLSTLGEIATIPQKRRTNAPIIMKTMRFHALTRGRDASIKRSPPFALSFDRSFHWIQGIRAQMAGMKYWIKHKIQSLPGMEPTFPQY